LAERKRPPASEGKDKAQRTGSAAPTSIRHPVVAIGASAGGLEACRQLLDAIPVPVGMSFIVVQHLDPDSPSMLADLLASHTGMKVREAADQSPIELDHVYVIPPGVYLSVSQGALRISRPTARHGARMPFDFLLHALAKDYGPLAACVILSGMGSDGSLGLPDIKAKGGFIVVQKPGEAAFGSMPDNAIATDLVDMILPVGEIPAALVKHFRTGRNAVNAGMAETSRPALTEIVELLRNETGHNFSLYKTGTLQRRIERRMGMAGMTIGNMAGYLDRLHRDPAELSALSKDLLIHVTRFFRDPEVFEALSASIIPEILSGRTKDDPVRIWVAGCSTGEETYSLAILFQEEIARQKLDVTLQVFASDVDADAIATARDGIYPSTIEGHVSAARLERFFTRGASGYSVVPELRAMVIFTVQDVLADPPFSRIDFVSCRNLLIYLKPEAQAKVITLLHFALSMGGVLLLGAAETAGVDVARLAVVSKAHRLYRKVGRSKPGELSFCRLVAGMPGLASRQGKNAVPLRTAILAELCRKLLLDAFAPAAVLVNRAYQCLYVLGGMDRYLRVADGMPSHDLLQLVPKEIRAKLRAALRRVGEGRPHVVVEGCRILGTGEDHTFRIDIRSVPLEGEELLLICFIDDVAGSLANAAPPMPKDIPRIARLERDLEATKAELIGAIRDLEVSNEAQKFVNDEALSVNEEYQSANEELLTSKEELQSLNEELTALNGQLQETLELQRTTSNDLQNVLYSTDIATIFLDRDLNIRFFTPATRSLFRVIATDVGRPLTDLTSLASDGALPRDARTVLETLVPVEREVEGADGAWFSRRVTPYRTHENGVEGVVVTFSDISEQKRTSVALDEARQRADRANAAKTRFLAAASHDLRQPLQTMTLIQGMLAKELKGERDARLVGRLGQSLLAMAGMLNTLLDISQIEAGTIQARVVDFDAQDLLDGVRNEFADVAQAQRLELRIVASTLRINGDPELLGQMLRNLVANAVKYTKEGCILVGLRRRNNTADFAVLDTGVGIPASELDTIFDEYHQIDNPARERSRGLGLGLAIVRRLGHLMKLRVTVRSRPGQGSGFAVEGIPLADSSPKRRPDDDTTHAAGGSAPRHTARVLVIEDDTELCALLQLLLVEEGHVVISCHDGVAALALVRERKFLPDLVLADYNLPNGINGVAVATQIRTLLGRQVAALILTGDTSSVAANDAARHDCMLIKKPVDAQEVTRTIQQLISARVEAPVVGDWSRELVRTAKTGEQSSVFIVDDDPQICEALRLVLETEGRAALTFSSSEAFLAAYRPGAGACLLLDASLPGMSGLDLLDHLHRLSDPMPVILITGKSDVAMAVQALRAGAADFIQKPVDADELLSSIERAIARSVDTGRSQAAREAAEAVIAQLTPRQREIMGMVLAGHPSKNIAADLGISQRTVENHRAEIMRRTGSRSLPALARLAVTASGA
jgi:two-component system CheB/CheR fusion protein